MTNKNRWHTIYACLFISLLTLAACAGEQKGSEIKAEINTPFELKIGQSAHVGLEGITIDFLEVTEDSRCPEDVECIVAGQVSILIRVSQDGSIQGEYTLTIGFEEDDAVAVAPGGFDIQLTAVAPYPSTSQDIERANYIATLLVSDN